MSGDSQFWANCASLWGLGGGYRADIANLNTAWFEDDNRGQLEEDLRRIIQSEWTAVLKKVTALLEVAPS
jgi:hypothetical protein